MSALKISALAAFVGSILFLIAAFMPISRVYMLSAPDKLALITAQREAWGFSQALFSAGSIVFAAGVGLAAFALRDQPAAPFLFVATAFLAAGAVVWSWHVYLRVIDPTAFAQGSLPGWQFASYTVLTMAAFLLIGIALLQMGFPAWAGWLLVGGSLLLFVLYVIFGDMPPFAHYLLGLAFAFALFRRG
ncbi:MAG: hypothetical protein ABIQ99_15850 [Thermoflexales bacterium]